MLESLPQVSEQDAEKLGAQIQADEIKYALSTTNSHESPGCDGLTKEFYDAFSNVLLPVF